MGTVVSKQVYFIINALHRYSFSNKQSLNVFISLHVFNQTNKMHSMHGEKTLTTCLGLGFGDKKSCLVTL